MENFIIIKKNEYHRLTGPAKEYSDYDKSYWINGTSYMFHNMKYNILYLSFNILKILQEYEIYIKQNIKDLITKYNPKIEFNFNKEQINELTYWLKDLLIL